MRGRARLAAAWGVLVLAGCGGGDGLPEPGRSYVLTESALVWPGPAPLGDYELAREGEVVDVLAIEPSKVKGLNYLRVDVGGHAGYISADAFRGSPTAAPAE